jgi:hypothetical protein
VNTPWFIYTPIKYETTHLNLTDEVLGSTLYPLQLLDLGDVLVVGPVVPMLVPYVDVLATIVGTTLYLLHIVVGGHLSFFALCATPNHGNGYHRTLTVVRSALLRGSLHWS